MNASFGSEDGIGTGTLSPDFFARVEEPLHDTEADESGRRPGMGMDKAYWAGTRFLWDAIKSAFPETAASVRGLTESSSAQAFEYSLIYGDVQSGKSRAIMVVAWYLLFVLRDRRPVVLTINLDSVRSDFTKKAGPDGEINRLVASVVRGERFKAIVCPLMSDAQILTMEAVGGFSGVALSVWFLLKPVEFRSMVGAPKVDGMLPVLLQNPSNLERLLDYHKSQIADGNKVVVIVDEIHKMYTEPMVKRLNGITHSLNVKNKTGINLMCMMYWLRQQCQRLKLHMIGVTATPSRAISDIHAYPGKVIRLDSDPITVGGTSLCYYGTFDSDLSHHIDFSPFDGADIIKSTVQTVRAVINRSHCKFKLGEKTLIAVKTVLVTVNRLQEDHQLLLEALKADPEIGELVETFVVNSDVDSGQRLDEVFSEIAEAATRTPKRRAKLSEGAVVIIGLGCFAAGVSVKPGAGQRVEFRRGGQNYSLFGITDQIYVGADREGDAKSLEQNIQAMRIFGWYPPDYSLRIWCPPLDLDILMDQLKTNRDLIYRYQTDPESIRTYTYTPHMTYRLFDRDPYRADKASHPVERVKQDKAPVWNDGRNLTEIKTSVFPVGKWMSESGRLAQFYDTGNSTLDCLFGNRQLQRFLRVEIEKVIRDERDKAGDPERYDLTLDRVKSRFQIPYSNVRYREIIKAAVHPGPTAGSAPVNAYLTGTMRERSDLSEIHLVIFDLEWDDLDRESGDRDCTYYFRDTPGTWIIVHPEHTHIKEHVHLDSMIHSQEELCDEHQAIIAGIDSVKRERQQFRYGWNLFVAVYKILYGKADIKTYSQKWRLFSDGQRNAFKDWRLEYHTITDKVHRQTKMWLNGDQSPQMGESELEIDPIFQYVTETTISNLFRLEIREKIVNHLAPA